jgi:c-di-GMP-binding flagellar brake protein YcgR
MQPQRGPRPIRLRRRSVDLLLLTRHGDVRGDVLDLSVRGCGAVFRPLVLPDLGPGDEAEVEFRSLLLLEPLRVRAIVRRVGELPGRSLLGLEFTDPEGLAERIPFVLAPDFDRRRTPRTVLREDVRVRVTTLELTDRATLLDLSVGGARLGLGPGLAFRVHSEDRLELRFSLPGRDGELWLFGVVRELRLSEQQVTCSVHFDPETTVRFAEQRERIEGFIEERRRRAQSRGRTAGSGGGGA